VDVSDVIRSSGGAAAADDDDDDDAEADAEEDDGTATASECTYADDTPASASFSSFVSAGLLLFK